MKKSYVVNIVLTEAKHEEGLATQLEISDCGDPLTLLKVFAASMRALVKGLMKHLGVDVKKESVISLFGNIINDALE